MLKNKENLKKILVILLITIMSGIIFYFQTQKSGLHEDEGYTLCSSVNPKNGVMDAYDNGNTNPVWRSREYVKSALSLVPGNILNFKALFMNQAYDNHPPFFYTLVHFATLFFGGNFSLYSAFIVNIIAFICSCVILIKILKLLKKENLVFPALILYGLSMGTISMVLFQRMYMLLTAFILLYFYLSLKLYKNNFIMDKKFTVQLGVATVLGFLTQYFFAIYAFFIFAIMLIEMFRTKTDKKVISKYVVSHVVYGALGILLFVPCLKHLFFSDRGLTNLGNSGYFAHIFDYLKHLSYAFSINNSNTALMVSILILFAIATIALCIKSKEKFVVLITIVPSVFYYFIAVKMTSFQELRYIMPVIPFIVLTFFFILNEFVTFKYNYVLFTVISIVLVSIGLAFSEPRFLYKNYKDILNIAEENKDKSFVYVYDNFFNHMQSVPEMMVYNRTLIINVNNNDELHCVIDDESLNNEDSYVLSIKAYMDNDAILNRIKDESVFKNVSVLYKAPEGLDANLAKDNLYLISK